MANGFNIIRQGESLPFVFDRSGDSIDGWICTIEVKRYPSSTSEITPREIAADGDTWPGFLTSTETSTFAVGNYRLVGVLTNATNNEEEQITETTRFNITDSWAT